MVSHPQSKINFDDHDTLDVNFQLKNRRRNIERVWKVAIDDLASK